MPTRFKAIGALGCLALSLSLAASAAAVEDSHTVMKFFAVTDKVVGGTYNERVEIQNISPDVLAAGTLQIEFPSQLKLVASSPAASLSGNVASISVPAISVGGSFTAFLTVKAVSDGQFVISAASYFVNGERFGFMSAPSNISATASSLGIEQPTATVAGVSTGGASALPVTGADLPTYFTAALLVISWGAIRSKISL